MIKQTHRIRNLVVTTRVLLLLAGAPIIPANPLSQYMNTMTGSITAQAAELPYSSNWETQADNSWRYRNTNGTYASGWIQDEVDKNWYYMNASQVMLSGLVKSDGGRYYLLSQDHDGHFGRMLENGQTYHGITIQADTSDTYRGALSNVTISQLRSIGLTVESAPDVSGSGHTTNGQTTPAGGNQTNQTNKSVTSTPKSTKSHSSSSEISQSQADRLRMIEVDTSVDPGGATKWK